MKRAAPRAPHPRSGRTWAPWAAVGLFAVYLGFCFRAPRADSPYPLNDFARLPVLAGGRIKPLDTLARNSLLMIHGRQTLQVHNQTQSAAAWLLDVLYRAPQADQEPVFEIDNPDVLGMIGIEQSRTRYYALNDLKPKLADIEAQANQAQNVKSEDRSHYQSAVLALQERLVLYERLENSLQIAGAVDVRAEVRDYWERLLPALSAHLTRKGPPASRLKELAHAAEKYKFIADSAAFFPLPGARGLDKMDWVSWGQGLLDGITRAHLNPGVDAYAAMGDAYRAGAAAAFNSALQ